MVVMLVRGCCRQELAWGCPFWLCPSLWLSCSPGHPPLFYTTYNTLGYRKLLASLRSQTAELPRTCSVHMGQGGLWSVSLACKSGTWPRCYSSGPLMWLIFFPPKMISLQCYFTPMFSLLSYFWHLTGFLQSSAFVLHFTKLLLLSFWGMGRATLSNAQGLLLALH